MASILSKTQSKKEKYKLKDLKTLGIQLLSSRSRINNLPLLLTFVNPKSPPQYVLESILSLQSFFTPIIPELPPSSSSSKVKVESKKKNKKDNDPELIYRTWLRSKFDEFVKLLIDVVVSSEAEETLKDIVLDAVMELVKMGKGGKFQSSIYHRLIHSIAHMPELDGFLLESLSSKYFKYIDVRYFTFISLDKLARGLELKDDKSLHKDSNGEVHSRASKDHPIHNIHLIISRIPPLESNNDKADHEMLVESESNGEQYARSQKAEGGTSDKDDKVLTAPKIEKKMKLKFSKAWLSFLRLPLPLDVYKEVLVTLHQTVIPHLSNPIMLCDFLIRSYDIGGVVSVMALSSLFILMTQHGLEYPNFYEKLYALLQPSIFMAKHRAKFLELLDSCLKSPLLPAYLAASFAKRLSRLALSVPPSGALVIIALIHNLLRRHPSINCLVHREDVDIDAKDQKEIQKENPSSGSEGGADVPIKPTLDPFCNEEANPMKTNAMRSSLWEIDTLRHHYCPPVSRFVLSLENDLTVRAKTTEINVKDFTSGSYATIFGDEMRRRVKQVPLAFYKTTPTSLFSESDFPGWTFQNKLDESKSENGENGTKNDVEKSAKRQRIEYS